MLEPAPISAIDPHTARGTLVELHEPASGDAGSVTLSFPNLQYRTHLVLVGGAEHLRGRVGKRVEGRVRGSARRVDVVPGGGRFVDPVWGRPRRVQGRVVSIDAGSNSITVHAGLPIELKLTDARQRAAEFAEGDLVSCDVLRGATFEPSAGERGGAGARAGGEAVVGEAAGGEGPVGEAGDGR